MRYSLCTRTNDQDYTWHHSTPEPIKRAQEYSEFFDGGVGDIFAVLYRLPICDNALTLIISVPTTRRDNCGRIIRSMAMLQSGSLEEDEKLKSFYSCVLQTEDQDGLKNANSDIAFAIEEIVTTKGKSFERFNSLCGSARFKFDVAMNALRNKKMFSRADISERKNAAWALGSIKQGESFFIAITYKNGADIVSKFELANSAIYMRVFSSRCIMGEVITVSQPQQKQVNKALIAGIATILGLCLMLSKCSKEDREVSANSDKAGIAADNSHMLTNTHENISATLMRTNKTESISH